MVRYDRPGTGLSDRGVPPASLAGEVDVLAAVVEAVGERVTILGGSSGGPAAIVYAAQSPPKVDRLVLYGAFAEGKAISSRLRSVSPWCRWSGRTGDSARGC